MILTSNPFWAIELRVCKSQQKCSDTQNHVELEDPTHNPNRTKFPIGNADHLPYQIIHFTAITLSPETDIAGEGKFLKLVCVVASTQAIVSVLFPSLYELLNLAQYSMLPGEY